MIGPICCICITATCFDRVASPASIETVQCRTAVSKRLDESSWFRFDVTCWRCSTDVAARADGSVGVPRALPAPSRPRLAALSLTIPAAAAAAVSAGTPTAPAHGAGAVRRPRLVPAQRQCGRVRGRGGISVATCRRGRSRSSRRSSDVGRAWQQHCL